MLDAGGVSFAVFGLAFANDLNMFELSLLIKAGFALLPSCAKLEPSPLETAADLIVAVPTACCPAGLETLAVPFMLVSFFKPVDFA